MSPSRVAEKSSVWRLVRREVEDAPDVGQEAHVGHAVGFVDDHDLDGVEPDAAPLDEVTQTTRDRRRRCPRPRDSALSWGP